MSPSEPQPTKIRPFLVLENRLLRDMLARVLRRRETMEIVGRGGLGEVSVEALTASGCDVVLVDFIEAGWLSLVKSQSQRKGKPIGIVAVGMDGNCEKFLEAVRCGVIGYLLKDASASEVVTALFATVRGEATCPPSLCTRLFQVVAQVGAGVSAKEEEGGIELTLRQQSLMKLVANGLTNKEIAQELRLSEFTVRNHISRILKQLNAENRSEAARVVKTRYFLDFGREQSARTYAHM